MRVDGYLVVAILIYLALDLSLVSMPGAFVFEAGDSVETVQRSRTLDAAAPVALVRQPRDVVTVEDTATKRQRANRDVLALSWIGLRTAPLRSNAAPEPAPAPRSEDPH